ncbi:hypothetical protein HDF26_001631 [Pedobacter cryoconitis]|uniref:eCIS core domain-containing protein n=1 Tax=Pedobacter cryoconitis TaxID=188932 RepID=UPI00160A9262|nr:DUF4157 domain-containing protein [Pedobacter cryoconitis]MBB6271204.1 hypothetical protein [Pedobacter cryoconitis]
MSLPADKTQQIKAQAPANISVQKQNSSNSPANFVDNRPEAIAQRELQETINNSPRIQQLKAYQEMADSYTHKIKQGKEYIEEDPIHEKSGPIQKKANNTGIPDNLKAGIENLSGYDISDVKVHYNSGKPAQLNAHAYAQGTDIHIATGQEKHLPHEAWHVVQQKQGRVSATRQLKQDVLINENTGLEAEADQMGQAALSIRPVARPVYMKTTAGDTSQRKVIQLITTQIVMNDSYRITQVIIRGRPPHVHRDSMGDHTTAFIVHTEGINIALQGKTLPEAGIYIELLMKDLLHLPGAKFMGIGVSGSVGTETGVRFMSEFAALNGHINTLKIILTSEMVDFNLGLQHIQLAVSAYLNARELVPFSTINVAAKSKGLAGKGRGESRPAAILSTYERGNGDKLEDFTLINAVYKLFDDQSSAMIAAEPYEPMVQRMSGGLSFGDYKDMETRFMIIWEQHRRSIERMFPKVYAKINGSLHTTHLLKNLETVKAINFIDLRTQMNRHLSLLGNSLRDYQVNFTRSIVYRGALNQKKLEAIARIYGHQSDARALLSEMYIINGQADKMFSGNISEIEQTLFNTQAAVNRTIPQYDPAIEGEMAMKMLASQAPKVLTASSNDPKRTIDHIKAYQHGNPLADFKPVISDIPSRDLSGYKRPGPQGSVGSDNKVPISTLTMGMSTMSIQIVLDSSGGLIRDMLSSGRPPSPFKATMGAHTTSWIVHLDRIRNIIAGKNIPAATAEILVLMASVRTLAESRVYSNKKNLGDNAINIFDTSFAEMNKYAAIDPATSNLIVLQQMINATLSFYNLIPGVSTDKINTSGHGEGTYRQTILRYEFYGHGSQSELRTAIAGLYDGGRSGQMFDLHGTFIRQAYPKAHLFATKGESTVEKKELPKTPIAQDTEEDDSDRQLSTSDVQEMELFKNDGNWLASVNNCLINAITDGAGIARATGDQVVAIRHLIGAPLGEMLYASERILNIITLQLGLQARGVIVLYQGGDGTDQTTTRGAHPIYIYHNGINHFTALQDHVRKPAPIKDEAVAIAED